uniref:Uncharacterized protein n=1 Tax=Picea glauca TaxID=3330 RepID=A0A117NI75_PICGL|nr:hypothetical protein ABT39_MTgene2758 [Picea glauca]QHR89672.1 hypothetical protein Q903MT_gene3694 [Picea sitchensis]
MSSLTPVLRTASALDCRKHHLLKESPLLPLILPFLKMRMRRRYLNPSSSAFPFPSLALRLASKSLRTSIHGSPTNSFLQ